MTKDFRISLAPHLKIYCDMKSEPATSSRGLDAALYLFYLNTKKTKKQKHTHFFKSTGGVHDSWRKRHATWTFPISWTCDMHGDPHARWSIWDPKVSTLGEDLSQILK